MSSSRASPRWTPKRAQAWRAEHGWMVGANFLPSTVSNQLEMWQAESFDPDTIDRELGWAAAIGMNVMRVYLHDLLLHTDRRGLFDRMERYLAISEQHGIGTVFVLLDDCWSDEAAVGPQPEPIPGVHNSTWLRCPAGRGVERAFEDPAVRDRVRAYVTGVIDRFRTDRRVVAWDLYNEPGNPGKATRRSASGGLAAYAERPMCRLATAAMVSWVFDWAAEVDPEQPLTVCLWRDDWVNGPLNQIAIARSDVASFHCYGDGPKMAASIETLTKLAPGRPIMCTEYLARGQGSTFEAALPVMRRHEVDAINWGLVAGRSNTIYPWTSWNEHGPTPEPAVWHHDIFRRDGTPFDPAETALIRSQTLDE